MCRRLALRSPLSPHKDRASLRQGKAVPGYFIKSDLVPKTEQTWWALNSRQQKLISLSSRD